MHLRTGIPLLAELEAHLKSEDYHRHVEFNRAFLEKNDAAMSQYGKLWAKDTFRLWSRRWEYPFVAQRVIDFARSHPNDRPFKVLDAGSGRSEEHTSELQSQSNLVCRLLLEKKKKK